MLEILPTVNNPLDSWFKTYDYELSRIYYKLSTFFRCFRPIRNLKGKFGDFESVIPTESAVDVQRHADFLQRT